ncbi:MAG: NUDIX hydrolase [Rhodobacter sp.]|nr:NUDIX hydrolase [Paracoccaceae bacterium]MCC0075504.1 NUDIX hydrolase [Rhodobacter sp.]
MKHTALAAYRTFLEPAFRRPEFVQTAALCVREGKKGPEILLVSSLTTKRWILPKGWPMEGRTLAEAALQEAWEEAGVQGSVEADSTGSFSYRKAVKGGIPVTCRCEVFRVDVDALADDWPERGRRQREWVTPREAAKRVEEPELKAILREIGS